VIAQLASLAGAAVAASAPRDPVPEGTPFNRKEIDAALKRQGGMRINKGAGPGRRRRLGADAALGLAKNAVLFDGSVGGLAQPGCTRGQHIYSSSRMRYGQ
jgi:hypothetical protein